MLQAHCCRAGCKYIISIQRHRGKEEKCCNQTTAEKGSNASDRTTQHSFPDRVSIFVCDGIRQSSKRKSAPNPSIVQPGPKKKAISVSDSTVPFIPNSHPQVLGKAVKVKFFVKEWGKEEWFDGMIQWYVRAIWNLFSMRWTDSGDVTRWWSGTCVKEIHS